MSKKFPNEKLDLTSKPKRPMDPAALSNDQATLRALVGQLNENPKGVDLNAPVDPTKYSGPTGVGNKTVPLDSMPDESALQEQLAQRSPQMVDPGNKITETNRPVPPAEGLRVNQEVVEAKPVPQRARRLVITGRGLGELVSRLTDARVFQLDKGAVEMVEWFFPDAKPETPGYAGFLKTVIAWGTGEITTDYPMTVERALFVELAHAEFGDAYGRNAGYWIDDTVKSIKEQPADQLIVVTGIQDLVALRFFQTMGFQHWHLTGPSGATVDSFSAQLDQDVIKAISQQRAGPRLRDRRPGTARPAPQIGS